MHTSLQLTPAALKQLEKLCEQQNGNGLLINIKTTGCSGYSYDLSVIKKPAKDDLVFEQENHRFVAINPKNLPFIAGSTLDYVREGLNARFKFLNPNEKGTCGCGESFTI
jgi:iron-sulfur cluster assembly protein